MRERGRGPRTAVSTLSNAGGRDSQSPCVRCWRRNPTAYIERHRLSRRAPTFDPSTIKEVLAPAPDPQRMICVGLNHADHAREVAAALSD